MTSTAPKPSANTPATAARRTIARRKPSPLALEARLMFDGAALATAIEATDHARPEVAQHDPIYAAADVRSSAAPMTAPAATQEIAFIDTTIANWQTLAAGLRGGIELVLLDPARDAFAQMAERLQGRSGLDAIHVVSHGSTGALVIGGQTYQSADLAAHGSELATIGQALGIQGDLLLYGCDVGRGSSGEALVEAIARATGADVAASTDTTGSAANFGGNWQLERASGAIESALFAPAALLSGFDGKLATINLSGNSGWTAIMYGNGKDPDGDSQAGAADTDIVGDATHGSLYAAYDDNGTVTTADDTLAFRLRIDNPTSNTYFGGVAIVGMDANLDGRADIFMAVDGRNNGQAVKLYDPGTGANISPNTTSTGPLPTGWLANGGVYAFSASNYAVTAVAASSDPHFGASSLDPANGSASDLAGDGKTDVFVSWRLPLADIAAVLAKASPVDRNGIYGPRGAAGIAGFTKDTVVQYVSFTQTQTGPINGDLNGVGASYDKNATFAQLGAYTTPMSPSTPVSAGPGITISEPVSGGYINDAEDNALALTGTTVAIADGTKVTITATDGSTTLIFVDAATVSANTWTTSGLDLSSLSNGALSFTAKASTAVDSASAIHDKSAPLVSIAQLGTAIAGKPTFSGTSDLADGTLLNVTIDADNVAGTANLVYQVMVSGGAWTLNTASVAPASGSMPAAGLSSFSKVSATATDSAGNSSTALALNRPTVNAVSTNDTTPVISGTWANIPGDSLTVTVNGVACTPAINGNTWSVQVAGALSSGAAYEVVATAARAGVPSVSDTTTLEATITSSPVIAIDITGDSAGDPTSNGTASGNSTLPIINGTSSNAGGFVVVRLDPNNDGNLADAVTYSVVPNGAGVWTLDTASATAISGTRPAGGFVGALGILASDSSGGVSDTQVLTITSPTLSIGSIASTASSTSLAAVNNGGAGANFLNLVEDNSVVFSGTATGGSSVNLTITDASGNFLTVNNVAVTGGTWTSTASPIDLSSLDNGTLTVRATLNGTSVSTTNTSVSHDKVAPLIFNTTSSEIKKSSPVITGASDLFNTVLSVSFTPAGGTLQTVDVTTDASGRWSTGALLNAPGGNPASAAVSVAPKIPATAIDGAGNIAQPLSWTQTMTANASTKTITVGSFNAGTDIVNSEVTSGVIISGTTTLTTSPVVSVRVTDINGNFADISTTASAGGAWSASLSNAAIKGLVNGPLTVKASAVESGSLTIYDIAVPASLSLTSPTVSVTDNVAGTATGAVLFTFTFAEGVSGFDINDIDVSNGTKGTFSTINSSTYTLLVTPTNNSAGNMVVGVAGAKAVSINTGRANVAGSDTQAFETTGAAAAPSVTVVTTALASDSTPVITGTSSLAAGAPVVISIDNDNDGVAELTYSATVQPDQSWRLDVGSSGPSSGTLPPGGLNTYARITATATNAYGNSSTAIGLNLPTVNPQTTNDNTPVISGNWTQIGGDTIAVVVNGTTYSVANGNLTATATGWSITAGTLADNTYNVSASTTRGGATAADLTSAELTIDTAAAVDIATSGGAAIGLTNDATPVIGGTVSGIEDGAILTLGIDADNNGSYELTYAVAVAAGTWSVDTAIATPTNGAFPAAGLNGTTPIRISGSDAAANSASDLQTLTVDVTPPAIAFTTNSKTADTTPLITGTSNLPAGATITIDVDPDNDGNWSNQQTYTTTVDANGRWSVQAGAQLTGTTLGLRASATDLAGNSASTLKPLEIVANAPSITITSPIASVGVDNIADVTEDDSIVIVGTTANVAPGSLVSVTITDGTITINDVVTVQAGGTWSLSALNLSAMANGGINVSAVVIDSAGDAYIDNTSFVHDKSAQVAIDSISLDTGVLADFITTDSSVTVSGSATPNAGVQVLIKNGGATVANFALSASASGSWTTATTPTLAPGQYTIEATVGGVTVTRAMTIVDASAPVLTNSTPGDNAVGVASGANLGLTFNKNIQAGAGFIALYRADGTLVESFNVATGAGDLGGSVSFNGSTGLVINPLSDLSASTAYYIKIAASAVIDAAGNAYAGIADDTTLNFTVGAADVTAPLITGPSGAAGDAASSKTINENASFVATLSASENVTWSLVGGVDAARFTVNTATGALSFVTAPDFEAPADNDANNTYVVQVQAVDGSGNASIQTVTVTVADVDEAPPAISGPSGGPGAPSSFVTINENTSAVATLAANESVSWSIGGGADAGGFVINATTGVLSFVSAPDFETPTDTDANNSYVVQVQAIDGNGNVSSQTVTVTVTDIDEVPAAITGPSGGPGAASSSVSINENASAVAIMAANESVSWSIGGGVDAARFVINASTGALSFVSAPDFEAPTDTDANNIYVVQVQAINGNGNVSGQTVTVTVSDIDEAPAAITGPSGGSGAAASSVTINENTSLAATMTANESVSWSIGGGADAARLTINASTGALSFLSAPDFEAPTDAGRDNIYQIVVQAIDANGNTSVQSVNVTIADVNESIADTTAPLITTPGAPGAAKTVTENSTPVLTLAANETVTWSLAGGADAAKFSIDANSGALRFVSAPDFESPTDIDANNTYIVQVQATDSSGNAATQSVSVTVADVDEAPPRITGPSGGSGDTTSSVEIRENSTAVSIFGADEPVTWSLVGGADAAKFSIDASTGSLIFASAPDFELPGDSSANNVYEVQVRATDIRGNSSVQTVSIRVTDVDEAAPLIAGAGGNPGDPVAVKAVPENTNTVATLSANEAVTWSISGGADGARFAIDAGTGSLRFINAPNFEAPLDTDADNTYVVQVRAVDAGGNAAVQQISVTVTDVDESVPDTIAPLISAEGGAAGAAASSITVNEMTTEVTRFSASEAVSWSLSGGADAARFAIDPVSGALRFVSAPDFEAPTDADADNSYTVLVQASDESGNTAVQQVTVHVADIDDSAPVLGGGASISVQIAEGSSAVTTLTANESVTWAIVGGIDRNQFAIDAGTGALRLLNASDFESPTDSDTNNSYVVQVKATDSRGNASLQTVNVNIVDGDDTAPAAPSLDLLPQSDSGSSATDDLTRVTTPTIRITLHGSGGAAPVAGEQVTLLVDGVAGASVVLSAQNVSAGYVDVTSPALAQGARNLSATRTDNAGNVSPGSPALTVTVDTNAPQAPTVDSAMSFTGTPVIAGSAAVVVGERLSVSVDGVTYTEGDGNLTRAGTRWSLAIPSSSALRTGVHSVSATLTDAAGNSSTDTSVNEVVVAERPIAVVVEEPAAPAPAPAPVATVPVAATPVETPPASIALPGEAPAPAVRGIAEDISNPIASAPALSIAAAPEERMTTSAEVTGMLTVRGNQAFQIAVLPASEPALVLYRGIRDQDVDQAKSAGFDFRIPSDAFMHTDANASVKLVAKLATGEPLPNWLVFDPTTGRFDGTVPAGMGGELVISVMAIDADGRHAETIFRIKLVGNKVVGRPGLAEQIRLAAKRPAGLIPMPRKAA